MERMAEELRLHTVKVCYDSLGLCLAYLCKRLDALPV